MDRPLNKQGAMKQLLTTLLVFSFTLSQAQWSSDPAAPMVLCNAANIQTGLKVISDGSGGWYAFWSDSRANASLSQLYGQHLDAGGNALWSENGLLILDQPDSSIDENLPVLLPNGDIMITYTYGPVGEVVKVMRLAPDGSTVWAAPVELVHESTGPLGIIGYFYALNAFVSGNGMWIAWAYSPQGGNITYAFERMDLDGTTHFGEPGHGTNNTGWGAFSIRDDLAGGFIMDWSEGGSFGALKAMRFDPNGFTMWANPLTVSAGTVADGVSNIRSTVSDSMGSYVSVFVPSGDIGMARYDTSGTFIWNPQPQYACNESHGQDEPSIVLEDNDLFVGWADNRPPAGNQDMYMQKIDMNGNLLWAVDGVPVIQFGTYIPTPVVVAGDDGAVFATFDGSWPGTGFVARRVLSDGSLDWAAPVQFCTSDFNPSYYRRTLLPDGVGGVTAFWQTFSNHLYAAHIDKYGNPGVTSGISEVNGAQMLNIYPNPATDRISFNTEVAMRSVRVLGMDGRTLIGPATCGKGQSELDVRSLAPGSYLVEAMNATGRMIGHFIKK